MVNVGTNSARTDKTLSKNPGTGILSRERNIFMETEGHEKHGAGWNIAFSPDYCLYSTISDSLFLSKNHHGLNLFIRISLVNL